MTIEILEGGENGKGLRIVVVASRFNDEITEPLLRGALAELKRCGVDDKDVHVVRVPGAFEIPVAVRGILQANRVDAVVAVGAVIRGETPHFDYVCEAALGGIAELARTTGIPITNGIITANTDEQAVARSSERAGYKQSNLGSAAARAAIDMALVLRRIGR